MGRKAKLKQIRRKVRSKVSLSPPPFPEEDSDPTEFIEPLERQGYQLHKIEKRCPELPDRSTKPQV